MVMTSLYGLLEVALAVVDSQPQTPTDRAEAIANGWKFGLIEPCGSAGLLPLYFNVHDR